MILDYSKVLFQLEIMTTFHDLVFFFYLKTPWCTFFLTTLCGKVQNFINTCHFSGIPEMKFSLLILYC